MARLAKKNETMSRLSHSAYLLILLFGSWIAVNSQPANAVGVAEIVVTSVYWGTNPMASTTAVPGDVNVPMSIMISNVGDDVARGVDATLRLVPPIRFSYFSDGKRIDASTISQGVGDLNAGQSFTLRFIVSVDADGKEGIHRLLLDLKYKSARELQEITITRNVDVPVWRGSLHVQRVSTNPAKLFPGAIQANLKVTIVNTGLGVSKDLTAKLELRPPFKPSSSGSDRIFLGTLQSNQAVEASFFVDIDEKANFGDYSIPLIGIPTSGPLLPLGEVPVFVNEKVRFTIMSIQPDELRVGDSGVVVKIRLKNSGSVKAESVRAQLKVGNFFSGTLTEFLGTFEAGEEKLASFTIDLDSKAQARSYKIDLRMDWTQSENAVSDTIAITLNVVPQQVPVALIGVGVAVVALAGVGFWFRRRRARKQQQG